jgi:hypothetical protein
LKTAIGFGIFDDLQGDAIFNRQAGVEIFELEKNAPRQTGGEPVESDEGSVADGLGDICELVFA